MKTISMPEDEYHEDLKRSGNRAVEFFLSQGISGVLRNIEKTYEHYKDFKDTSGFQNHHEAVKLLAYLEKIRKGEV